MTAMTDEYMYEAEIENLSNGDELSYYLMVNDVSGRNQSLPITAPEKVFSSTISVPVSFDETSAQNFPAVLYPNPVKNSLQIQWQKTGERLLSISLYNHKGQRILSKKVAEDSIDYRLELGEYALSSGIYILSLNTSKGSHAHRVLVIR